jgi:hypothetical protein
MLSPGGAGHFSSEVRYYTCATRFPTYSRECILRQLTFWIHGISWKKGLWHSWTKYEVGRLWEEGRIACVIKVPVTKVAIWISY